jgi:hypothetical protein
LSLRVPAKSADHLSWGLPAGPASPSLDGRRPNLYDSACCRVLTGASPVELPAPVGPGRNRPTISQGKRPSGAPNHNLPTNWPYIWSTGLICCATCDVFRTGSVPKDSETPRGPRRTENRTINQDPDLSFYIPLGPPNFLGTVVSPLGEGPEQEPCCEQEARPR